MSGSLTHRSYISDSGTNYTIKVDESNANAFGTLGTSLCAVRTANAPYPPKTLKKRYVLATALQNPNIRRRFYVGSLATFQGLLSQTSRILTAATYPSADGTQAAVSDQWVMTFSKGEEARTPPDFSAPDTGLTDGTVTQ